jgi:soluble lytic murein transglycosylase-like protein
VTWECVSESARRFGVPLAMVLMVMDAEAGEVGLASRNRNGTRDLGPMQINTVWLGELEAKGLTEAAIRDDGCLNAAAGAWILAGHLLRTKSFARALGDYHSRVPDRGRRYLEGVLARAGRLDVRRTLERANRPLAGAPAAAGASGAAPR